MKLVQTGIFAFALSLFVISCGDTAEKAEDAAEATTEAVETAAEETGEAMENAAETVDSMATEAGEKMEEMAEGHDHAEGEGHEHLINKKDYNQKGLHYGAAFFYALPSTTITISPLGVWFS